MTGVADGVVTPGVQSQPYASPSFGRRLVGGGLLLIPLFALWVALPVYAGAFLGQYGVRIGLPLPTVLILGSSIAVLGAAAYVLRPTRAYGPILLAGGALSLLFLLWFSESAVVSVAVPNGGLATVGYGAVLLGLAVVVVVRLLAAVVVTAQDLRNPTERLAYEFPATVYSN